MVNEYDIEGASSAEGLISGGKLILDLSNDQNNEGNYAFEIGFIRNNDMIFVDEYISNNDAALRINGWRKENDDYILNIVNGTKYSISDTELKLRGLIKNDNGEIIFSSNYFIISVKGTTIVDYKYELCFENHIKTKDIIFKDDEAKILKINSIRHKIVNGKEVGIDRAM